MSSTYSEYLRLELIGTGEQTGTWGNTTNTNLGTLLDQAVAGTATIDVTLGDVTLTALNGASDQSRQAILKITGTPIAARNVIAPEQSKWYLISNECGQTITLKGASTTGYAIATGETLLMFWNGTDFVPGSSTALGYTPVNKAGDTMSGALYLPATTPTLATQATTKAYVDGAVSGAVGSNFVLKTGDTMTGALTLSGAPTTSLQAATKGYVDSAISGAGYATQSWVTSQNYANTTTQSLQYYYTKTDSDSRYVSTSTQNLQYYTLTTQLPTVIDNLGYTKLSGTNSWTGANSFSQSTTFSGASTITLNGNATNPIQVSSGSNTGLLAASSVGFGPSSTGFYYNSSYIGCLVQGSGVFNAYSNGEFNVANTVAIGGGNPYGARLMVNAASGQTPIITYANNSGTNNAIAFFNPAGSCGYISTTGTTTNYGTSSDYRLKENIQPVQNALDTVVQINPVTFNWRFDGSSATGFIAHELQAIVPSAVVGKKDAVDEEGKPQYQNVDPSKLIGLLTAAIQELKAEVDALKAAK